MKKITSLLLVFVMVCSMAITVFASGSDSITVKGAKKGEIYRIYKMLDLSVSENQEAYTYTINPEWETFFTTGAGKDYIELVNGKYVTWKQGKDSAAEMEAFGKAAEAYAVDGNNHVTEAAEAIEATADGNIIFQNLESGYYLITSTYGTKVIVNTTPVQSNVEIKEKNQGHIIIKKVQEDSKVNTQDEWGDYNSAQIGQTVYFETTLTIKSGAQNLVMHDSMDEGLTFDQTSVKVLNGTDLTAVDAENYKIISNPQHTEDNKTCTFHIEFQQDYLDTIKTDTTLLVTYSAVLNEKADSTAGQNNDVKLKWGNDSKTEWDTTTTYTYEFELLKYSAKDTTKAPLAGAKFSLCTDENGTNKIALVKVDDNTYRIATASEMENGGTVTEFVTNANGNIKIVGLDLEDSYYLIEIEAPAGYNPITKPVEIQIKADAENPVKQITLVVEVANNTGTILPSAGGTGTTIFYLSGSVFLCAAVILLIVKKRMRDHE